MQAITNYSYENKMHLSGKTDYTGTQHFGKHPERMVTKL